MSQRAVEDFLHRHSKIGIDTNILVFEVEENPKYVRLVDPIFLWLLKSGSHAVTSTITMLEVLVRPYRRLDMERVADYYALLSTYPNLEWIAPTLEIAGRAARLRAEHNLGTPDAIQAATALTAEASGLISNDITFRRLHELDVLILDDLA